MNFLCQNGPGLYWREDGTADGAPLVFVNALGTDLRVWNRVLPALPKGLRIIRFDKRGHGLSDCPPAPYSMGALVHDTERLLDALKVRDAVIVGLSAGGMIAQALAVKRMDQVRALVLSNTGAKIGTRQLWQDRIDAVREGGIASVSDMVLERWFSRRFRESQVLGLWRNMLERQPAEGYAGVCAAISHTDLMTPTSSLSLPTLAIAGSEDGSTPPDLVRETAALIKGSRFHLIRGAGHLPCVETPDEFGRVLTDFLKEIGHV